MDNTPESAIAALRATGLHRCTSCKPDGCDTPTACLQPEPGSELSAPAKAVVYAATLAVALIGVAAALFS